MKTSIDLIDIDLIKNRYSEIYEISTRYFMMFINNLAIGMVSLKYFSKKIAELSIFSFNKVKINKSIVSDINKLCKLSGLKTIIVKTVVKSVLKICLRFGMSVIRSKNNEFILKKEF